MRKLKKIFPYKKVKPSLRYTNRSEGFFCEIRILRLLGYIAGGRGKRQKNFFRKFLREIRIFPDSQYIAVRRDKSLSEMEVPQMQDAMREPAERDARDEEIIDILIAISVVSKRLAEKLRKLNGKETTT